MKTSAQKATAKKNEKTPRLRRKPFKESELPLEARELHRRFREWDDSFQSRAKRMAYIRKLCKRIAEAYQPEKIILFGSHAYGTPTRESDVDLLIVMDYEDHPLGQTVKMRFDLGLVTPMDLLVRRPEEVKRRVAEGDKFMRLIVERGKVMYEAKHDGVDRKS
ncbi:MAG: nucleotidyltransferase domain-containing protein [Blastocatellia bacterium]